MVDGTSHGASIPMMTMPDRTERAALVALLRRPGLRWFDVVTGIQEHGSAVEILERELSNEAHLFSEDDALEETIAAAAVQIAAWEADRIAVHCFFDDGYPRQLRDVHEMPPIVFSRGSLPEDGKAVAVVGTRQATPRGIEIAKAVARELVRNDVVVVSGLAAGIDTAAHRSALEANGRTAAIIGTGVNRYYPRENKELQLEIERRGYVLSQFWPDAAPTKRSFPMRNAVMSGISAATVVVEAGWKSGARMQARLALKHGRPVLLPRELLEHDWARRYAEMPGVTVVGSAEDLVGSVGKILAEPTELADAIAELPDLVAR